jgi:hypothetical protein
VDASDNELVVNKGVTGEERDSLVEIINELMTSIHSQFDQTIDTIQALGNHRPGSEVNLNDT